jgi:large subunit ribosomal protein L23
MAAFWNKSKKDDKEGKEKVDEKTSEKNVVKKEEESQEIKKEAKVSSGIDSKKDSKKDEKDKKKKKKTKVKFANFKEKAELVNNIIVSPVVSEDAMNKEVQSKYVFKVSVDSNKSEIKEALEARFKVTVEKVNIIRYKTKEHKFRYRKGKKKGFKKAIVTVKKGDKIELFK